MNRTHLFIVLLLAVSSLMAQENKINQTDARGKKQGIWRKTTTDGIRIYEGQFRDDKPYGEFRYFYPQGQVKAVSKFMPGGGKAYTVTYFPNGKKMAEGIFVNEKRDSLWKFFSEFDGALLSEEWYSDGVKNGLARTYYGEKGVAETMTWKDGKRDGPWEQYYTDGTLKLRGRFSNDEKEGKITAFHLNGKTMAEMNYEEGEPEGTWYYFSENGELLKKEIYRQGLLIRTEETGPE